MACSGLLRVFPRRAAGWGSLPRRQLFAAVPGQLQWRYGRPAEAKHSQETIFWKTSSLKGLGKGMEVWMKIWYDIIWKWVSTWATSKICCKRMQDNASETFAINTRLHDYCTGSAGLLGQRSFMNPFQRWASSPNQVHGKTSPYLEDQIL